MTTAHRSVIFIGPQASPGIGQAIADEGFGRTGKMVTLSAGILDLRQVEVRWVGVPPAPTDKINLASPEWDGSEPAPLQWVEYDGVDWSANDTQLIAVRL